MTALEGRNRPQISQTQGTGVRLAVVSHSYIEPSLQRKWQALLDADPEMRIMLITPHEWPERDFWKSTARPRVSDRFEVVSVRAALCGYVGRYFFLSPRWIWALRRFRPNVIQVEAEPWSAIYFQVALVRRSLFGDAKLTFFTWWNTARVLAVPFRLTHSWCLASTDLVVAGNHGALEVLQGHGYKGPIVVVPQVGVDPDEFSPGPPARHVAQRLGSPGRFTVGYVGRLTWPKGVDTLIAAVAHLRDPGIRLVIAGDGPERDSLRVHARHVGIEQQVVFLGAVAREEVPEYMRCMDVLVLPSRREQWEQFGHVLVEAMAAAVPVVGSTSGEIPRVVLGAGLVFPIGDHAALARAIRLLVSDSGLRMACAKAGTGLVQRHYSHEAVGRRLAGVYKELAASAREHHESGTAS
jgi:L-malate glycosyltransferase